MLAHAAGRLSSAARASVSQPPSRGVIVAARAISVSAAARTSAILPSTSRPSISFTARSTSAASGSIAISRTAGSNAEPLSHRVVKSSALPSSTIRSARRTRSENAPSVASAMPRGLSRITAGACVAASSRASSARPLTLESCGPAKMIGRAAAAMAASTASATESGSAGADDARASGHTIALLSTRSSSRSDGRLRVHRPRPARRGDADRFADITAERRGGRRGERRLGDRRRHVGLADFLEAAAAELPGRRVTRQQHHRQFRAERRVERADRVGMARPAGDHRDAGLAGEPSPRVRHVHGGRLVAHVNEIELRLDRGIEHRHDVIAREREHALRTEPRERARHDVGAAQRLAVSHSERSD